MRGPKSNTRTYLQVVFAMQVRGKMALDLMRVSSCRRPSYYPMNSGKKGRGKGGTRKENEKEDRGEMRRRRGKEGREK